MVSKKLIKPHLLLILFLILIFILRIPSFFEPYWYGDEGIYLTLGQAKRAGLVFYRDIHDNKPPLLYLLAAVAGGVSWFRLITAFFNLLNIVVVYWLATRVFGRKNRIVWLVTFLFGLLTTLPWLEGNIANAEIFMILPICAGFLLLWNSLMKKEEVRILFWGGVLFSLGVLFKMPAGFDFLAVFVFLIFTQKNYLSKNLILLGKRFFYLLLGFFIPISLTIVYYGLMGGLRQYLEAAFLQNLGYLSTWSGGQSLPLWQKEVFWRGVILIGFLVGVWIMRKKTSRVFLLFFVWFLMALFGSLLSGRPYPHYLLQAVPPFCFLMGLLLTKLRRVEIVFLVLAFALGLFSIMYYRFYLYETASYYRNFLEFGLGRKNKLEYYRYFGGEVVDNYRIARFLKQRDGEDERIFIWGDSPCLYALSGRLPAGRYTAAYHISDFGEYKQTMESLRKTNPNYVVWMRSEKRPFKELEGYLRARYTKVGVIGGNKIYRRIM